jgi:hypothetical protein
MLHVEGKIQKQEYSRLLRAAGYLQIFKVFTCFQQNGKFSPKITSTIDYSQILISVNNEFT